MHGKWKLYKLEFTLNSLKHNDIGGMHGSSFSSMLGFVKNSDNFNEMSLTEVCADRQPVCEGMTGDMRAMCDTDELLQVCRLTDGQCHDLHQ